MGDRKLISYPVLFGMLISLAIAALLLMLVVWFPRAVDAWDRHGGFVQALWYTAAIFGVVIYRFRRWSCRLSFWLLISLLFVFHVSAVALYSSHVHPLLGWEWIVLILFEVFIAVFLLDWWLSKHQIRGHHPGRA